MIDLIGQLSDLPGVSSYEDSVREWLLARAEEAGCSCEIDRLGNLIVHKRGKKAPASPLLLTAHMDEVGLMITHITDEGYLHFDTVGHLDRRVLIGKRVFVNGIPGVIGIKAIHLVSKEERKKTPALDSLYIDIGAESGEIARNLISLGDVACFQRGCSPFGSGLVKGPALSGRIPCAILLKLLQEDSPVDYSVAFTVQQEVGSRGIFGAAFRIKPGVALVVDTCPARDVPGAGASGLKLGEGVGIALREKRTVYDVPLSRQLLTLAEQNSIPARLLADGLASQGGSLQTSRSGVTTAVVKVPVRYTGTPSCVAKPDDADAAVRLLQVFLKHFGELLR